MPKDPQRWQEVIIDSAYGKLTKQDVHDYYQRSDIKNKILSAIKATGSPETILRQSFSPGHTVLRRKDHQGNLIDLSRSKDFNDWAKLRMSEVHPVFGKKTNMLLADIDPGEKVPWNKVKSIADTVAKAMNVADDVKDIQVQFSGDRGFYVKGILNQAIDVNEARGKVKDLMSGLAQRPDVTLGKAKVDQIRIDTTPLKNRGSVKAPYSLSAVTGLVAAPVDIKKLPGVKREDFKIENVKTAAKKEFAPGIPAAKKIDTIPKIKDKAWQLSVQLHDAHKAGKHYDLRLVDPRTDKAHSFAVPKARLPGRKDSFLLAVQQPTHTADYALNFEGSIPTGTYGAGDVRFKIKPEPINVIKANADRISFERPGGQQYSLFRMKDSNWGFRRKKT